MRGGSDSNDGNDGTGVVVKPYTIATNLNCVFTIREIHSRNECTVDLKDGWAGILDAREDSLEDPDEHSAKIRRVEERPRPSLQSLFPSSVFCDGEQRGATAAVTAAVKLQIGMLPYCRRIPLSDFNGSSPRWAELPPRELSMLVLLNNVAQLPLLQELFFDKNKSHWKLAVLVAPDTGSRSEGGVTSGEEVKLVSSIVENCQWTLWRANPIFERYRELLSRPDTDKSLAVDFGCGSGRDSVWLAMRGWRVVGIDCVKKAVARADAFALQHGVDGNARFLHAKLENLFSEAGEGCTSEPPREDGAPSLVEHSASLVVVSRTRVENRFDLIDRLLKKNGLLFYHHFLEGCVHPTEGLLRRNELAEQFNQNYEIIVDAVYEEPNDGRKLSLFAARKIA